jgi:cytochrome c peroxidase
MYRAFASAIAAAGLMGRDGEFHNNALHLTDVRKFETPTLRNIAVTAPYMHDGSIATLEEVLDHSTAGGRARANPGKDELMHGFFLTPQNRVDLIAFLRSLTDERLLYDPRFADPWKYAHGYARAGDPRATVERMIA